MKDGYVNPQGFYIDLKLKRRMKMILEADPNYIREQQIREGLKRKTSPTRMAYLEKKIEERGLQSLTEDEWEDYLSNGVDIRMWPEGPDRIIKKFVRRAIMKLRKEGDPDICKIFSLFDNDGDAVAYLTKIALNDCYKKEQK